MRYYLAGPMRGFPEYNFPKFHEATSELRRLGHDVFNPAERDLQDGFDPSVDKALPLAYYMRIDLPAVCESDAVVVLSGWQLSDGANIEVFVATQCGIPVLEYPSLEPIKPAPPIVAYKTVREVMQEGLKKHAADSWRNEESFNHVGKSARHLLTAQLISEGHCEPDGEDHLANGICRAVMAKAQRVG